VTIVDPGGTPGFRAFLRGDVPRVVVHAERRPISEDARIGAVLAEAPGRHDAARATTPHDGA
jgi:hypothetical protein